METLDQGQIVVWLNKIENRVSVLEASPGKKKAFKRGCKMFKSTNDDPMRDTINIETCKQFSDEDQWERIMAAAQKFGKDGKLSFSQFEKMTKYLKKRKEDLDIYREGKDVLRKI